jgi:hypothetical protein
MKTIKVRFIANNSGNCRDEYREIGRNGRKIIKFHHPDPDGRTWYSADNKIWEPDCPYDMNRIQFEVIA